MNAPIMQKPSPAAWLLPQPHPTSRSLTPPPRLCPSTDPCFQALDTWLPPPESGRPPSGEGLPVPTHPRTGGREGAHFLPCLLSRQDTNDGYKLLCFSRTNRKGGGPAAWEEATGRWRVQGTPHPRQQPGGGRLQLHCFAAANMSEPISRARFRGPTARKAKSHSLLGPPGRQDPVAEGRQTADTEAEVAN